MSDSPLGECRILTRRARHPSLRGSPAVVRPRSPGGSGVGEHGAVVPGTVRLAWRRLRGGWIGRFGLSLIVVTSLGWVGLLESGGGRLYAPLFTIAFGGACAFAGSSPGNVRATQEDYRNDGGRLMREDLFLIGGVVTLLLGISGLAIVLIR